MSASEIPVGQLIGLIVLVVIAALGLIFGGRVRARRSDVDPALVDVPLSITGLEKSYPGGVKAVKDVSFRVEAGQVLGLLGPNGAGKTTTLRMVMGLITPTAGEIRVFGRKIEPGSEILSRIGSFVEGSGFLPHLSGKANLDLYWKATGRPAEDAHMAEALEIAGLGDAIDRRVRTYSQGMRQRLAIAQAMLGLPDLLLMDEPTNGLDPPQIHAMREVLRRYAQTGRTVLVSSHLLSEVEQTCSHVVVVHLGRTIASGTVAELVSSSGEMSFTVDDREAAARVLRTLAGDVEITENGVQADLGTRPGRPGGRRPGVGRCRGQLGRTAEPTGGRLPDPDRRVRLRGRRRPAGRADPGGEHRRRTGRLTAPTTVAPAHPAGRSPMTSVRRTRHPRPLRREIGR